MSSTRPRRRSSAPDIAQQIFWSWDPRSSPESNFSDSPWSSNAVTQTTPVVNAAQELIARSRKRSSAPNSPKTSVFLNRGLSNDILKNKYIVDNEAELDDSYFEQRAAIRQNRRNSSKSSRSKSVDLGSSFNSTVERVIHSILDEDESQSPGRLPRISAPASGMRAKRMSATFQTYNHLAEFDMLEAEELPIELINDLKSQGCPFCGSTALCPQNVSKSNFAIMFCRRLGCRHVAHNVCITENSVKQLIPYHCSLWFLSKIASSRHEKKVLSSGKRSFFAEVKVFNIASNILLGNYVSPKPLTTSNYEHVLNSSIETLVVKPVSPAKSLFDLEVSIGRVLIVLASSERREKEFMIAANFDLTDSSDKCDLVLSDDNQAVFVTLKAEKRNGKICLSSVHFEIGEPKIIQSERSLFLPSFTVAEDKELDRSSFSMQADFDEVKEFNSSIKELSNSIHSDSNLRDSGSSLHSSQSHSLKHSSSQTDPSTLEMYLQVQELLASFPENQYHLISETPTLNSLFPLLCGHVAEISRTQIGSRFLQQLVQDENAQFFEVIFKEVTEKLPDLIVDLFGNYLCQLLYRHCDSEHRMRLLNRLSERIADISRDRQGTRVMQKIIQYSSSNNDQRDFIMNSLMSSMLRLMHDPHGSYVINALIEQNPFDSLSGLLKLACQNCVTLAVDQHGLCVLKKLLARCSTESDLKLIGKVLEHVNDLVNNQYGNYLVQHILTLENEDYKARLHSRLSGKYNLLSKQKFSSNVVEKCLHSYSETHKSQLINELMNSTDVVSLLQDSYGNYVMQNALNSSRGEQVKELVKVIKPHVKSLRKNIQKKWEKLVKTAEEQIVQTSKA
jgi:hypothetical protein